MAVTKLLRKAKRNVMIPQNKQTLMIDYIGRVFFSTANKRTGRGAVQNAHVEKNYY